MSFVEREELKVISKKKHKRVKTSIANQIMSSPYSSKKTASKDVDMYATLANIYFFHFKIKQTYSDMKYVM